MPAKDVFVIPYSTKFAVRFETGHNLKLLKTLEDAIDYTWMTAKPFDTDVYIEDEKGKRKKLKRPTK